MDVLWCILGRSGSGKDTLLDSLLKNYFPLRRKLISKTTRAPRFDGESCHVFSTEADLVVDRAAGQVVAYNNYAGNHYWATHEQVDNADFYIVDVPGLIQLKKDYKGRKKIMAVGLKVSPETSMMRMLKRGDAAEKVAERLSIDDAAFAGLESLVDISLTTDLLAEKDTAKIIAYCMKVFEDVINKTEE